MVMGLLNERMHRAHAPHSREIAEQPKNSCDLQGSTAAHFSYPLPPRSVKVQAAEASPLELRTLGLRDCQTEESYTHTAEITLSF